MPFPNDDTKFKSGQSGNPNGRPKKLPDLDDLLADVLGQETKGIPAAKEILLALRKKAKKGDIRAAEVLLNRGYGMPLQKQELTGKDGAAIITPYSDEQVNKIIESIREARTT